MGLPEAVQTAAASPQIRAASRVKFIRVTLILDFIQVYLTRNGYSPTYEEIRSGVGLGSTNTVEYHIRQMKKDGLLIHDPAKPRSLVLVTTA